LDATAVQTTEGPAALPSIKLTFAAASLLLLTGCNAGAIAIGMLSNRQIAPTTASGSVRTAPAAVKVGYLKWIELLNNGTVTGQRDFDLATKKNVSFEKSVAPANGAFSIEILPSTDAAEGTYVVMAWEDTNGNGAYDGDAGEKRAAEVYRFRGLASTTALWTAEKFLFTEKQLSIVYATATDLAFTFTP